MLGSKVTWVTTASCCYTILGNVFLLNGRQQSPTFCKGLNISRMQAFVRLPTEFDNLLQNAAGYFDVSPNLSTANGLRLKNRATLDQFWKRSEVPCHRDQAAKVVALKVLIPMD